MNEKRRELMICQFTLALFIGMSVIIGDRKLSCACLKDWFNHNYLDVSDISLTLYLTCPNLYPRGRKAAVQRYIPGMIVGYACAIEGNIAVFNNFIFQ